MNKISLDKEKLIDFLALHTRNEAAEYFGVSLHTIARRLHEYGINATDCRMSVYPDALTERQTNMLIGWMLGDGCIPNVKKKNFYFKFGQCPIRKGYVEYVHNMMMPFSYDVKYDGAKYYFYTASLPIFTKLRSEWYEKDRKIVPASLKLNWEIVSFWFADDGCNYKRKKRVILHTNGFTEEEVIFLIKGLKELNVDSKLTMVYNKLYDRWYPTIKIDTASYFSFMKEVGDHLAGITCLDKKTDIINAGVINIFDYRCEILNQYQQKTIRELYVQGCTISKLSEEYKVSISTIERCIYSCPEIKLLRKQYRHTAG